MQKITNLKDLLIEQTRELYNAEKQQLNALPKMKEKTTTRELDLAIKNHIDETTHQIKRLEDIFQKLDTTSFGELSESMKELIKESYELIERSSDPEVLDAAMIAGIQYMKHFEIAGYGIACTYANELGLTDIADQLYLSLKEEKELNSLLSEMATDRINKKAKTPIIA